MKIHYISFFVFFKSHFFDVLTFVPGCWFVSQSTFERHRVIFFSKKVLSFSKNKVCTVLQSDNSFFFSQSCPRKDVLVANCISKYMDFNLKSTGLKMRFWTHTHIHTHPPTHPHTQCERENCINNYWCRWRSYDNDNDNLFILWTA